MLGHALSADPREQSAPLPQFLEQQLGLRIPVTKFGGDIHLSTTEKDSPPPYKEIGIPDHYWIIVAGGKFDFTTKWWNPANYQAVVDHFRDKIHFVQCGESHHWHPQLNGVTNLVGRTKLRDFVRLVYHADGILCPVTFAMHLAASMQPKRNGSTVRACVVIAGAREPAHWEAYPNHQFLSTNGALPCCAHGGCWKSRCQTVGDGDPKDSRDLCEQPVQITPDLRIARCMDLITPGDVIRRIELYYQGGCLTYHNGHPVPMTALEAVQPVQSDEVHVEPFSPPIAKTQVLLQFRHGLGDAVQFTAVLQHLRQFKPDWEFDVASLIGKHTAFTGVCRKSLVLDRDPIDSERYDQTVRIDWHECRSAHADWPSTKVARCLLEVFQITPVPELCKYVIHRGESAQSLAREYLQSICPGGPNEDGRFPAVLIHYEGNTSSDRKNLTHELAKDVCDAILAAGAVPVILDWDRRSPWPDGIRIHNPGSDNKLWGEIGTGDAEAMAALIEASRLVIGVDSGPLHVAGATTTATIGVWTHHHPVHYFDLASNVVHMVPGNHEHLVTGPQALAFFEQHYRRHVYKQISIELPSLVESILTGEDFERIANRRFLHRLSSRAFDVNYYQEHKLAGLDYLGFGDWQQQYGRWFVESLALKHKRVLDVGCACGAILRGLGESGAIVQGVDLNEHMIRLGREKWPDMASLMFVCDAVNLHLFGDGSWDAIHTAQVAEHWKPELVPFILREIARVVVPGGLMFCALDTEELFARQNRTLEHEDPTHVCIRPMSWWHEQLAEHGWTVCSAGYEPALKNHPESFLHRYDWDWFVARRNG